MSVISSSTNESVCATLINCIHSFIQFIQIIQITSFDINIGITHLALNKTISHFNIKSNKNHNQSQNHAISTGKFHLIKTILICLSKKITNQKGKSLKKIIGFFELLLFPNKKFFISFIQVHINKHSHK